MRTTPRSHSPAAQGGFTLIELLTVITIIMVLVGMIIGIAGLVQNKQARAAAEGQLQALALAIESYKVDYGTVPRPPEADALDARTAGNPDSYKTASLALYVELSGDTDKNRTRSTEAEKELKSYFPFKPNMLSPSGGAGTVAYISDPFGYSYGYSTARAAQIEEGQTPSKGYNPTYDLWSTGGARDKQNGNDGKWIKNW